MTAFKLKMQMPKEDALQQALVQWMRWAKIPHIHIPNEGKRSYAMYNWLLSMGFRPGASDLFVPRMKGGFGGYWVELKQHGKKPTENQMTFLEDMRAEGYKAEWFDSWEAAQKSIEEYLAL